MMMMQKSYTVPEPSDILGGRGATPFNHPGNQLLRETIVDRLDDYNNPCNTRKHKHAIIHDMINSVQAKEGRFLKFDDAAGQWFIASLKEFRLKISHAFRDASIPNKVKCIDKMRSDKTKAAWEPIQLKVRRPSTKKSQDDAMCEKLGEVLSCTFQATSLPIPKMDDDDNEPRRFCQRSPRVSFTLSFLASQDSDGERRPSIARLDELLIDFDSSHFDDLDGLLVDVFDDN